MVVKPATKFQEFRLSHKKQKRKQSILLTVKTNKEELATTLQANRDPKKGLDQHEATI
jgi:hypothetical protein